MADRLCTSVRPYKKGQSPIFGYFLPGTSRHTVRFRVNEMKRQKKTSFRGQSGAWLQEDSVRGGRVLGSISLHD